MKIAVWCDGSINYDIMNLFSFNGDEITCYIDSHYDNRTHFIGETPVLAPSGLADRTYHVDKILFLMLSEESVASAMRLLDQWGMLRNEIKEVGFLVITFDEKGNGFVQSVRWIKTDKPIIISLQAHVIDTCNLNCKGCGHFANLFRGNTNCDLAKFSDELETLSKKVYVKKFYLLGGEPFLNPELPELIQVSRKYFPQAEIRIATNGLLIPKLDDQVFEAIRRYDAIVYITAYPPTVSMMDDILRQLKKHNVSYDIRKVTEFWAGHTEEPINDPLVSRKNCASDLCRTLRDGRVYKCPGSAFYYKFKHEYQSKVSVDMMGADIYASDFLTQLSKLDGTVPFCYYYAEHPRIFTWEGNRVKPEYRDWLANPNER